MTLFELKKIWEITGFVIIQIELLIVRKYTRITGNNFCLF